MIYKRGNVYWIEFMHNGQRVRRSTGVSNKKAAGDIERELRIGLARGTLGLEHRQPTPTLKQFAQPFMDQIALERASRPATVKFYSEKLSRLLEFEPLRDAQLNVIDESKIDAYIAWRMQQSIQPGRYQRRKAAKMPAEATVNRQLATLRRLLRMAYRRKLIQRVPQIKLLAGEGRREFVLAPEMERAYLAAAPEPLRSVAMLCLDTGMRLSECLYLRAADVQRQQMPGSPYGCIRVSRSKSASGLRFIPLSARAAAVVDENLAKQPVTWLFESDPGKPYLGTSLDHLHAKTRRALKLPAEFVLHSLRHTFCTRLAAAGADVWIIQKLAGHAHIVTSQRYVHAAPEALGIAVQRMTAGMLN